MKKTVKKIILSIFLLSSLCFAFNLEECYKIYPKDADTLFMNALSAINKTDKFEISEIQTKNGYILFLYNSKYYLLTLTKRYQNQTEIKILPQFSDFADGSNVAQEVFMLIDNQLQSNSLRQVK